MDGDLLTFVVSGSLSIMVRRAVTQDVRLAHQEDNSLVVIYPIMIIAWWSDTPLCNSQMSKQGCQVAPGVMAEYSYSVLWKNCPYRIQHTLRCIIRDIWRKVNCKMCY